MLVIRGALKDYDWGIVDGLSVWIDPPGAAAPATGRPQAELWFGVHQGGPSPLVDSAGQMTGGHLADHVDAADVPLLVKLLAAARPLSVQVHPAGERAGQLWAAQQAVGARAVLSDPCEKTEMLVALGSFEALAGWRPVSQAVAILERVRGTEAAVSALRGGDTATAIRSLLAVDDARAAIAQLPTAVADVSDDESERRAYSTIASLHPADPGALLTPLLAFVVLERGEALYVPAGVPHSYLSGTGLEVMTSSDNVLRLGLTGKAVFVDEALSALEWDRQPSVVRARMGDRIAPDGAPFVARLEAAGTRDLPRGRYRIVLVLEGLSRVSTPSADVQLRPGTAAVIAADEADARVTFDGLAAVLTDDTEGLAGA